MQPATKRRGDGFAGSNRNGLALVRSRAVAVACCRAALRDERHGYPFTAAMEWRKAAYRFRSMPDIAESCWRQWERLMKLPRRFAEPIGERRLVARLCSSRGNSRDLRGHLNEAARAAETEVLDDLPGLPLAA